VNDSNWTLSVTEDFSSLIIDSKQRIRIKKDGTSSSYDCPLVFVDIYKEDSDSRSVSSAAHSLVSHGLARPVNDSRIVVNWYSSFCDSLVSDTDNIVESMRWIDLHRLQMPEFFLDDTSSSVEDSMSVSLSCQDFSSHHTASKVKPNAAISNCLKYGAPSTGDLYHCREDWAASGSKQMKMNFSKQGLSDGIKKLDEIIASPKIRAYDEKPYHRDEPVAAVTKTRHKGDLAETVGKIFAKDPLSLANMEQLKMLATQSWVESNDFSGQDSCSNSQNLSPTFKDRSDRAAKQNQTSLRPKGSRSEIEVSEFQRERHYNGVAISKPCSLVRDFRGESEPVRDQNAAEVIQKREMSAGDLKRVTVDTSSHKQSQFSDVAYYGTENRSSSTSNVRSGCSMFAVSEEEHNISVSPNGPSGKLIQERKISPHAKSQNSVVSARNKNTECSAKLSESNGFVTELPNESTDVGKPKAGRKSSAVSAKHKGRPINSVRLTSLKECEQVAVPVPLTTTYGEENRISDTEGQVPDKRQRVEPHITTGFPLVRLTVPSDHRFAVAASVIESPGRFWVHAVNDEVEKIDALSVKLAQYAKSAKVSSNKPVHVELYAICCAPSRIDGLLYRAEIISICYGDVSCSLTVESGVVIRSCECDHVRIRTANEATSVRAACVLFVDYGNSEWTKPSDLLPVPEDLLDIPQMAICCQLEALEPITKNTDLIQENQWSKEAVDCFTSLVGYDRLLWAFVDADLKQGSVISYVVFNFFVFF